VTGQSFLAVEISDKTVVRFGRLSTMYQQISQWERDATVDSVRARLVLMRDNVLNALEELVSDSIVKYYEVDRGGYDKIAALVFTRRHRQPSPSPAKIERQARHRRRRTQ
jgi:hypothetical protein